MEIKILDITGKVVLSKSFQVEIKQSIDISSLKNGLYFVKFNNKLVSLLSTNYAFIDFKKNEGVSPVVSLKALLNTEIELNPTSSAIDAIV